MRSIIQIFTRNREFRRFIYLLIALSLLFSSAAFIHSALTALLVLVACLLLSIVFVFFTSGRYRQLILLSEEINKVLHGNAALVINNLSEGELAILASEVQKMTIRLREQADILVRDKQYLSESLADIAHQIRTPITTIGIINAMLAREATSQTTGQLDLHRRAELTRELDIQLQRIDWLITTLLKISRIDANTAEFNIVDTSIELLLEKSLQPFALQLELKAVSVQTSGCGSLLCDLAWTAEAIGNIFKNCLDYVSEDGSGRIEITTQENQLFTEIVISDNGSGFTDEDLPHIFKRFYKGRSASQMSFGIGLALAKMIISQQNGTIRAENKPDGGARFIIRFLRQQV